MMPIGLPLLGKLSGKNDLLVLALAGKCKMEYEKVNDGQAHMRRALVEKNGM